MAWNPCPRVPLRGPSGFVFGPPGGHKDRQMRSKKWAAWRPPRRGPNWFSDCKKPYSMCAVLVRVRLSGGWYQD